MTQTTEFKRYKGIIGKMLYRLGVVQQSFNLPLFGLQGVGKSYFLLSLGMFISRRKLGKPANMTGDLLNSYWAEILSGNPISITQGKWDVDLLIDRIYTNDLKIALERQAFFDKGLEHIEHSEDYEQLLADADKLSTRIFLRTNDISGQEFSDAMRQLREPTRELGGDPMSKKFIQVVKNGDGAVMVMDLVRQNLTAAEYQKHREHYIHQAFAEQLVPLARGIELAFRNQRDFKIRYPLFLVFPKRDIHGLSSNELNNLVNRMFAMTFARLEEKVSIHIHSIQNMGFEKDEHNDPTISRGLGQFLADIYAVFH